MNYNISQLLLLLQGFCLAGSIVFILMQNRGASISGSLGGSGANEVYLTKRGIEKWVVNLTVLFIALFIILRIISLYVG